MDKLSNPISFIIMFLIYRDIIKFTVDEFINIYEILVRKKGLKKNI